MRPLLLVGLALTGCARSTAPATPAATPEEARAETMSDALGSLEEAVNAVVAGDVQHMRSAMRRLAGHHGDTVFPHEMKGELSALRDAAEDAARVSDVRAGATALADIGARCGACHVAHPAGAAAAAGRMEPEAFALLAHDGEDQSVRTHMQGHSVAVRVLWYGLMAPSDALWTEGTTFLSHMEGWTTDQGASLSGVLRYLEPRVHDLPSAADADQRTAAFAALLTACTDCHQATGGGPGVETP